MQEFIKQCGFVIIALLVLVIIRQAKGEMQIPIKLTVSVVLFGVFVGILGGVLDGIESILTHIGASKYVTVMLKATFVGIVSSICTSLCNDAGEGTLSYICTLLGKAQILILSIPLIIEILDMAIKLIDGAGI